MATLPWFAFDREAYVSNTMHLTTEEHGAYLLLMLTYYGTGKPLPGYERALASIAKVSLDRWAILSVALRPFFVEDTTEHGSIWRHERIEAELLAASSKHAAAVAKSKAANEARYGKKAARDAPSIPQGAPKPTRSKKSAPSNPAPSHEHAPSKPEPSSNDPHLQEPTLSNERVVAGAKNDDNPAKAIEESKEESFNPLGTTLPETWVPSAIDQETAKAYGLEPIDIETEVLTFHAYNAQHGTFSKNWSATWQMWCARWKERQATKAKAPAARVEVNNVPSAENWDRACALWAKGSSAWPRKSLGAEPGQPGCKCPNIFLTKHNIDPATGRVAAPSKEPVS